MVSGYRPIQDSLIVFPKTMYQTVTNDNTIILVIQAVGILG